MSQFYHEKGSQMKKGTMQSIKKLILGGLILSFSFIVHAGKDSQQKSELLSRAKERSGNELSCRFLYAIEQGFLNQHIKYSSLDDTLEQRTIDQYIKKLDSGKVYLLQSDIEKIQNMMKGVFAKVKNKDCTVFAAVQKIYLDRVKERAEFAKKFLTAKTYKFDPKTEILFDPDKKQYPKTIEDANDYMKKYVHFQISNYLITDMKLGEAKGNVKRNYDRLEKRVADVKDEDLLADYLDSFARALDPHSSFFSRSVLEDFEISMSRSLEGIGATLSSQDGFTIVEQLVPGGAAAKSNQIEPQDRILAVGNGTSGKLENVIELDLRDVVSKIRGPKGTKVRLKIWRKKGEKPETFTVTLTRDKVNLEDEAASIRYLDKDLNGQKKKIGIIDLPSFYADSKRGGVSSAADVKKLLVEAKKQKVDGIVLDLSNNGGGSLDDAVKIAGLFFQTGNVVKQSSRDENRTESSLKDVDPTVNYAGPLVVLTSRISASASEIVSGTLQDYKRAVIAGGDHTFGKGSVQSVVTIPQDLGAIKVTVGMFFTPGGNSTQHRGVEADVIFPGPFDGDEVGEKSLDYTLPPKKIASFLSPEAYVKEGVGAWQQIQPDWIKQLKEKSQARVAQSSDFKKIIEDLKKAQDRGKVLKLSEVLNDKGEKEKKKKARVSGRKEKEKEYLKRADLQESINVLLDLIAIEGQTRVAAGH